MPTEPIDVENWITQLRKGVLELAILNLLAEKDLYGYDIVKALATVKGLVISEGTIYPLLSRLKRLDMLQTHFEESASGPVRKYYALTTEGKRTRTVMNACWNDMVEGIAWLQDKPEKHHG